MYRVFSQRAEARIELAEWQRHAATFFSTRLEIAGPWRVRVEHARDRGERTIRAAPVSDAERDEAREAEKRAGTSGLADLARRCPTMWILETEGDDDRVALRLAAILAGVLLGPILAPDGALIGPKTARERLERP